MKTKILMAVLIVAAIGLFTSVKSIQRGNTPKKVEVNSIKKDVIANAEIIPPIRIVPPPPPPPPPANSRS